MKRIVTRSISTLAVCTMVGVGSMSAMAGPAAASGSTTTRVCTALANQANNILTPLANATAADNAAQAAFNADQVALSSDLSTFVAAIAAVISDVDAGITNQSHLSAFSKAESDFVDVFVATSTDRVAAFKTSTALSQVQLQQSTISQLRSSLCGPGA